MRGKNTQANTGYCPAKKLSKSLYRQLDEGSDLYGVSIKAFTAFAETLEAYLRRDWQPGIA